MCVVDADGWKGGQVEKNLFDIDGLRGAVKPLMKPKRYLHTLGVEREAAALGELYMPDKVPELRCAALLHDITKNETTEKQLQYCTEFDIMVSNSDMVSPKLFHAKTASALISRDFAEYATEDIISAVRWHTTGRYGMRLFDAIIYLADYIEECRTFADCVRLREYFWLADPAGMTDEERLLHLYKTMVKSVDFTVECLIAESAYIDADTIGCRNYYLELLMRSEDSGNCIAGQKGLDL